MSTLEQGALLPPATDLPIAALQRCVSRELQQRARVYPRLIEKGTMSREQAEAEYRAMQAIAAHLLACRGEVFADGDRVACEFDSGKVVVSLQRSAGASVTMLELPVDAAMAIGHAMLSVVDKQRHARKA